MILPATDVMLTFFYPLIPTSFASKLNTHILYCLIAFFLIKWCVQLAFSVNTAKEACILVSHFYELGPYHFNVAIN